MSEDNAIVEATERGGIKLKSRVNHTDKPYLCFILHKQLNDYFTALSDSCRFFCQILLFPYLDRSPWDGGGCHPDSFTSWVNLGGLFNSSGEEYGTPHLWGDPGGRDLTGAVREGRKTIHTEELGVNWANWRRSCRILEAQCCLLYTTEQKGRATVYSWTRSQCLSVITYR